MTIDTSVLDRFLGANPDVQRDLLVDLPPVGSQLEKFASARGHVGWYRTGRITLFPHLCTRPGTGYSWPGHVSDRTVQGVLAHELGHHCHLTRPDAMRIMETFPRRCRVTGYEPNASESFAESFRLFVLNPSLLREGRLERYVYLIDLGFVPCESRHWNEILSGIPPRMAARLPRWIAEGQRTRQGVLL